MLKKKLMAFCLAVGVMAGSAAFGDAPSQLRFMAGPPGGNWFALGGALADAWTASGLPTTSVTGGAVANIINANNNKGELGFSNTSMVAVAQKGEEPFKGALSNAQVMANLYTQYTYFIARKDFATKYGIKTVEDLVNKKVPTRFATLKTGTGSEFMVNGLFKHAFGLDYRKAFKDWGGSVEYASYSGGADLLADNHLDVFAFSVGKIASIVMQIESQTDIVVLGVGPESMTKLSEHLGTVPFTVEPGIYKSVTEPVPVIGDYTCIVVRGNLDEDVVYKLCKDMYEHKDNLAKAVVDMQELTPDQAVPQAPIVTHPGAVKYWTEVSGK